MDKKYHGILYLLRNQLNGKVYIGQTIQTLERRWYEHRIDSLTGTKHLYRAIRKAGVENFVCVELGTAQSQEELDAMEIQAIRNFDSTSREFGYNLRPGGSGGPLSEEHKRKIGAANAISLRGKKQSPELIERRVSRIRGRKRHPEEIAKTSAALKGRKQSPEQRENNRQGQRGKKLTTAHKAAIAAGLKRSREQQQNKE